MNNLYAAHISCNRQKQTQDNRTVRKQYGRKAAPLSKEKKKKNQIKNMIGMGVSGAVVGRAIGGPPGALIGSTIGGMIGNDMDPDSK